MKNKLILGLILLTPILIFILQNSEQVPIRFLGWTFSLSHALLVLILLLVGFIFGYLASSLQKMKKTAKVDRPESQV